MKETEQKAPVAPINAKVAKEDPQKPQVKETKYCTLLQTCKLEDEDDLGYTYAFEKIYIKELKREEIRICLYKDMRDRSHKIVNKLICRPCDLTEKQLLILLEKSIKEHLFSDEFLKYLRNIANQK